MLVMHLRQPFFDLIQAGTKTIEVRVAYPHRRDICAGQLIRFESDDDSVLTSVARVARYASFEDLLDHEDPAAIGGPQRSRAELLATLRELYDENKEALGVLAIEVTLRPNT